ncbi:hypothetical protein [Petroclostridium sp. X23]|nr:hypothetical protein [Petroclostridium sp. X23]WHH58870.1 hypothetical protein QKW49_24270 [Petroclostridium sp. X23]
MTKIYLHKGIRKRIENGHPWVYKNEVDTVEGEYDAGDVEL